MKNKKLTTLLAALIAAITLMTFGVFGQTEPSQSQDAPMVESKSIKPITVDDIKSSQEKDAAERAASGEVRIIRAPWENNSEVPRLPNTYMTAFVMQCTQDMYIESITYISDTPRASSLISNLRLIIDYNQVGSPVDLVRKGRVFEAKFDTPFLCTENPSHYVNLIVDFSPTAAGSIRLGITDIKVTAPRRNPVPVYTLPLYSANHPIIAPHIAGTNVRMGDGTVWLITNIGTIRRYTPDAFNTYAFNNPQDIVPVNNADLSLPWGEPILPVEGRLYVNPQGLIVMVSGNTLHGFGGNDIVTAMGFNVTTAPHNIDLSDGVMGYSIVSVNERHPKGCLINDGGVVYYTTEFGKIGIVSIDAYRSWWGNSFTNVLPATSGDRGLPIESGFIQSRIPGQLEPR